MITEKIIDDTYVYENIGRIFPNSIILRTNYEIVSVSTEIEKLFKYNPGELVGLNILKLIRDEFSEFDRYAHELVDKGFFRSRPFAANDQFGEEIYIELSGFYLGLISDINDLLILSVNDLHTAKNYKNQLKERENIFHQLVYRTYHEIKGPIATIKGLTSLCEQTKDDSEKRKIMKLINDSAKLLDSRITNISQFYEINESHMYQSSDIDLREIEKEAKEILNKNKSYNKIKFDLQASDILSFNINGAGVTQAIMSFLKGVTFFKINGISPSVSLNVSKLGTKIKLEFNLNSLAASESLKIKLIENDFSIEQAIKDESVLRFYIVRNQIHLLEGSIQYFFEGCNLMKCEALVPFYC